MTLEEQIEAIVDKRIAESNAPLLYKLEVQERILAKIPFQVSTNEAMSLTKMGREKLEKTFTKLQDGPKGRIFYSLVEIERWIAEHKLAA